MQKFNKKLKKNKKTFKFYFEGFWCYGLLNIINSIEDNGIINTLIKEKLAQVVRDHYKKYPQSLKYQASGNTIPNTVNNHIK